MLHTKKINFTWHESHCLSWSYLLLLISGLDRWTRLTEVRSVSYSGSLPSEHGKFFWARIYNPAEKGYTKERHFLKHKRINLCILSLTSSFRSTQMQLCWMEEYFPNGEHYGLFISGFEHKTFISTTVSEQQSGRWKALITSAGFVSFFPRADRG